MQQVVLADRVLSFDGRVFEVFGEPAIRAHVAVLQLAIDGAPGEALRVDAGGTSFSLNAEDAAIARPLLASAHSATLIPLDLRASGLRARGACIEVAREPAGDLVDCALTIAVRLPDGAPAYKARCRVSLMPESAEAIKGMGTVLPIVVDAENRGRIAVAFGEVPPVVTVNDPPVLDSLAEAARRGESCRAELLGWEHQFLRTPAGDELLTATVRFADDGYVKQVVLPVRPGAGPMLTVGRMLDGRRLFRERNILLVDWDAGQNPA